MRDEEYLNLAHGHTGSCSYVTSAGAFNCNCYANHPDEEPDMPQIEVPCLHCGVSPCTNKNVQVAIHKAHDEHCDKWVQFCDCKSIYVDKWVGSIKQCQHPSFIGSCTGVKIDPMRTCTCVPDISVDFLMPDMKTFNRDTRYYPCSGEIFHCNGCNHQDHTGDTDWEDHRCPPKEPKPDLVAIYVPDDNDIPF